jgi:hypothetical protein
LHENKEHDADVGVDDAEEHGDSVFLEIPAPIATTDTIATTDIIATTATTATNDLVRPD